MLRFLASTSFSGLPWSMIVVADCKEIAYHVTKSASICRHTVCSRSINDRAKASKVGV